MNGDAVTVAIPSIPPRANTLLPAAMRSVFAQTRPADAVVVAVDTGRDGAAVTRGRALAMVRTPWVAFLDDDDEMYPMHLAKLAQMARVTGADYVFSYFDRARTADPFAQERPEGHFGHVFDPGDPHHTTMTILVRTELARRVGFTRRPDGDIVGGEDWRFTLGCVEAGAKIVHLPMETWFYRVHLKPGIPVEEGRVYTMDDLANTSGREDRW